MNYRHAYHAGNYADVVKHAILALLIQHMKAKDKAFRVIDTHAGVGSYDLNGPLAAKTGEWKNGIGRLMNSEGKPAAPLTRKLAEALAPYFAAIAAANRPGTFETYPGSPWIIRHSLRGIDRMTAVELHPEDYKTLAEAFAGDIQVKAIELDGWLALGSFVPPKERRGLVLIDPPFEQPDEFKTMVEGLEKAYRRWPTGTYALWYPIKDIGAVKNFHKRLFDTGITKILAAELWIRERATPDRFNGTGLILVNPPWQLDVTIDDLLTGLAPILGETDKAGRRVWWIRGEE